MTVFFVELTPCHHADELYVGSFRHRPECGGENLLPCDPIHQFQSFWRNCNKNKESNCIKVLVKDVLSS